MLPSLEVSKPVKRKLLQIRWNNSGKMLETLSFTRTGGEVSFLACSQLEVYTMTHLFWASLLSNSKTTLTCNVRFPSESLMFSAENSKTSLKMPSKTMMTSFRFFTLHSLSLVSSHQLKLSALNGSTAQLSMTLTFSQESTNVSMLASKKKTSLLMLSSPALLTSNKSMLKITSQLACSSVSSKSLPSIHPWTASSELNSLSLKPTSDMQSHLLRLFLLLFILW